MKIYIGNGSLYLNGPNYYVYTCGFTYSLTRLIMERRWRTILYISYASYKPQSGLADPDQWVLGSNIYILCNGSSSNCLRRKLSFKQHLVTGCTRRCQNENFRCCHAVSDISSKWWHFRLVKERGVILCYWADGNDHSFWNQTTVEFGLRWLVIFLENYEM